jgi:2-polyprenyl-6-methoxyphenol hydroxylase-like FAD-dependent oxidoreductase
MMLQRVVVAGGGIGGLTFAAAARRAGVQHVTVIERESDVCRANTGSGLGLW